MRSPLRSLAAVRREEYFSRRTEDITTEEGKYDGGDDATIYNKKHIS